MVVSFFFFLIGCQDKNHLMRQELLSHINEEEIDIEVPYMDENDLEGMMFGGFSSYHLYSDDLGYESVYLKEDTYVHLMIDWTYLEGLLTLNQLSLTYINLETEQTIYIEAPLILEKTFNQDDYEKYILDLTDMQLQDMLWLMDALDVEVIE